MTADASARTAPPAPVTLAVVNAHVWTGNPRRPWADALAVRGDRLAAVGSSAEVRKLAGAGARVVDAKGQMVIPGFADSPVDILPDGFRLSPVQLSDASHPVTVADPELGTLERGRLADFVLVDRDLTRIAPETIRDVQVVMTVVGGRVVYERGAAVTASPTSVAH